MSTCLRAPSNNARSTSVLRANTREGSTRTVRARTLERHQNEDTTRCLGRGKALRRQLACLYYSTSGARRLAMLLHARLGPGLQTLPCAPHSLTIPCSSYFVAVSIGSADRRDLKHELYLPPWCLTVSQISAIAPNATATTATSAMVWWIFRGFDAWILGLNARRTCWPPRTT